MVIITLWILGLYGIFISKYVKDIIPVRIIVGTI